MSSSNILSAFLDIVNEHLSIRGASRKYHVTYMTIINVILALGKAHGVRISVKSPKLIESENHVN